MPHRRTSPLLPLLLVLVCATAAAQLSIALKADGPDYLKPGAPFTLARTTHLTTRLQNGSELTHEMHERITRDARGRVFDLLLPVLSDPLLTPAQTYLLGDPLQGTVTEWGSKGKQAIQTKLPPGARLQLIALQQTSPDMKKMPSSVTTTTEDLGTQQIAGFDTKGTRTTTLVPANTVGNTAPLRFITEVWISPELDIPLRELDQNPLTGSRTMNTEKLDRTAGGDALFHLPGGLDVRVLTPPATAAAQGTAQLAYNKALDDLKAPETREAAADTVVAYAQTHDGEAAHAAHMLAIRGTHLKEARSLAEGAVARMEQATATLTLANLGPGSFLQMTSLAEAWDALGSVYAASQDGATARRFYRSSWRLGGRGMTMDRLAQLEVHENNRTAALEDDRIALGGSLDPHDKDEITRRAQRLGDATPAASADPASLLTMPNPGSLEGDAHLDLLLHAAGKPEIRWLDGPPSLKALLPSLLEQNTAPDLPDAGPEHLAKQVHLVCETQTKTCTATLLYAWQATAAAQP